MKLERNALIHYIKEDALSASWNIIGKDIDDMSVDMGGSFETRKNILGETTTVDSGYTPTIAVTPYYADPEDPIYPTLRDAALERKKNVTGKYLEVVVEDTEDESHLAYQEDCIIEINNYGGNQEGLNIAYTIHPNGNRQKGTVTLQNKVPTFVVG